MSSCLFGAAYSSGDDVDEASAAIEGAPADDVIAPGEIMEAARATAVAAVTALLPDDAALRRLPEIRARAAAELRDAASDLNLSLATQRSEVRPRRAAATAVARYAVCKETSQATALRCALMLATPAAPGGACGGDVGRRELRRAA